MSSQHLPRPGNIGPSSVKREVVSGDPLLGPLTNQFPPPPGPPPSYNSAVVSLEPEFKTLSLAEQLNQSTTAFIEDCKIQPLDLNEVPHNLIGLAQLMSLSIWQNVSSLATELLLKNSFAHDSGKTVSVIKFLSLFKLKSYDQLVAEVTAFLESETNGCQLESSISIPLRLLLSEVKIMTGRSHEAFDELKLLKLELETEDSSSGSIFWIWQLDCYVINGYVRLRNWKAVISEMKSTIVALDNRIARATGPLREKLIKSQVVLLLRLSRILLQIGSTHASVFFTGQAKHIYAEAFSDAEDVEIQQHFALMQGLSYFGSEKYEQAMDEFLKVLDLASQCEEQQKQSTAAGVSEDTDIECLNRAFKETIEPEECESIVAAATNNFSICCLYLKKISMASSKLEELIKANPAKYMVDPVVFNLCTLYDVSYAPDISTMKKKTLQQVAAQFSIVDPVLHWRSFLLN